MENTTQYTQEEQKALKMLKNDLKPAPTTKKLIYVTKKQIIEYIDREIHRHKIDKYQLLNEVENLLHDLNKFKQENANQIKFFNRVGQYLNNKHI